MYVSLARKYRPKTFASVAVQSHVSNTLKGAIARGRVAHGYLLCGPRGVGKTTLARVLAMALNCERRGDAGDGAGEPCGECASCQRIWSGSASLDVVEIDAASNRGVDDARDLRERAMYAPSTESHYKVYIVDEAHMLTREAWNALLKILEEPPPRVVFVFATTEPQKIAQAAAPVLSRLQRFDLKRIGPADVRDRLATVLAAESIEADPDALAALARAADGSMRDALSLTDQVLSLGEGRVTSARVRDALGLVAEDEYLAVLDVIAEQRAGDVFATMARLADAGVDLGGFLSGLADMLRAQLAVTLGGQAGELSDRACAALAERRNRLAAGDLLRMLQAIGELEPRFRRSGQQQLLLETLLVRFALLDRTVTLEELLRGMGGGAAGANPESPRGGAAPPPRPNPPAPRARDSAAPAQRPADGDSPSTTGVARAASARPGEAADASNAGLPGGGERSADAADRSSTTRDGDASPRAVAELSNGGGAPRRGLELNTLVERWEEVVAAVRTDGRAMLASALERSLPVAVSGRGDIMLELDEQNEILDQAIVSGAAQLTLVIGALFGGAPRVSVRRAGVVAGSATAPRRLTEGAVKEERLAHLRKRDPLLASAIDALDLELME